MPPNPETQWLELFTRNDALHFEEKTIAKMSALLKALPRADALRVIARGLEQNSEAWRDIQSDLRRLLFEEKGEVTPDLTRPIMRHIDRELGNVDAAPELVTERVAYALGAAPAGMSAAAAGASPSKSAGAAPPPERPMTADEEQTWKAVTAEINSEEEWNELLIPLLNFFNYEDAKWTAEERRYVFSRVGAHVGNTALPAEWREQMLSTASNALRKPDAEEAATLRAVTFEAAISGALREANPVILEALGDFMQGQRHFEDAAAAAVLIAGAKQEPSEGDRWLVALGRFALAEARDFLLERAAHAVNQDARGYALVGLSRLPARMLVDAKDRFGQVLEAAIAAATSEQKRFHALGISSLLGAASAAGLAASLPRAQQLVVDAVQTLDGMYGRMGSAIAILDHFDRNGLPADPPLTDADILAVCHDMVATFEACQKTLGGSAAFSHLLRKVKSSADYVRELSARFAKTKHEVNPDLVLLNRKHHVQVIHDWKQRMTTI